MQRFIKEGIDVHIANVEQYIQQQPSAIMSRAQELYYLYKLQEMGNEKFPPIVEQPKVAPKVQQKKMKVVK